MRIFIDQMIRQEVAFALRDRSPQALGFSVQSRIEFSGDNRSECLRFRYFFIYMQNGTVHVNKNI